MNELVRLEKRNDVAIITIDNPPVNAIGAGVPEGIAAALDSVEKDPQVRAVVLIGAGRTFMAGADIRELEELAAGRGATVGERLSDGQPGGARGAIYRIEQEQAVLSLPSAFFGAHAAAGQARQDG